MKKCLNPNCSNMTDNPKYCSRTCSAVVNNSVHVKRKRRGPNHCVDCGKEISKNATRCISCSRKGSKVNPNKPIREFFYGNDANKYAGIRGMARTVFFNANENASCSGCGYSKHVNVCHIKPISDFDPSTPIGVVNSLDNLIGLCPNCHWEFDNGLFNI